MTYPIAVLVIAFIVSGILLIKVVPQFQEVFAGFGADLPAFTLMVIGISEFAQQWWFVIALGIAGAISGLIFVHKRSKPFREALDKMLLKDPLPETSSKSPRLPASRAHCRQRSPPVCPWWTL